MTLHFTAAALALLIERLFGYPKPLYDKIGHPVEWIGTILKKLETLLCDPEAEPVQARLRGVAALLLLLLIVAIPAVLVASILSTFKFGWVIEALLATALIAQHSLYEHVNAVRKGLDISLPEGRKAVAKIVGRDPAALDESGVVKGALESLAENASDGIVAPVLWYALLGLPGIVAYKAINTADSMIGHKSERYIYFGWAAARLDDLINLPASRLTGFLFAAAAAWNDKERGKIALQSMWRDAPKHQSPNAGWPESALAASLGVKFGGPRSYDGSRVNLPWMGEGRETLNRDDIRKGLRLYGTAMTFLLCLAAACALLF
ncbi:MAG: adenosylcobinamide-phosphate synthase CbiB [Aestuariivirga sp.]